MKIGKYEYVKSLEEFEKDWNKYNKRWKNNYLKQPKILDIEFPAIFEYIPSDDAHFCGSIIYHKEVPEDFYKEALKIMTKIEKSIKELKNILL